MNIEIIKLKEIIHELGYTNIILENDFYVKILFYNSIKEKNMIFVVSYNKSDPERYLDVGIIGIEPNHKSASGFFTIIREVTKENVVTALSIVEESAPLCGNSFIIYHKDIDKVIKEYASIYDYSL